MVTCQEGKRSCEGGRWGACLGGQTVFRSDGAMGAIRFAALGSPQSCGNACDPSCMGWGGDGGDNSDNVDAGQGLEPVDGGWTLAPGDGFTCVGLQCQEVKCDAASTTVTGTVYDPAGYNLRSGGL
jgi:hypothetical protein